MTRDTLPAPLAVMLLVTTLAAISAPSAAQSDDALDLARLAVHEAGWDHPAEPAAIYAVAVAQGARTGMTWQRWLRVHSRRFASHSVRRSWVYRLDRAGSDPHARISWAAHRERWEAILAAADAAIGAPPVCVAQTWGSARDRERARRLGRRFAIVDCGDTRNGFLVWR